MKEFKVCSCGTKNPIEVKDCIVCGDDIRDLPVRKESRGKIVDTEPKAKKKGRPKGSKKNK